MSTYTSAVPSRQRPAGSVSQLPSEDVVLFRELNLYDWYAGVGPAVVALEAVGLAQRMMKGIEDSAENSAFRSAIITPEDWDPDDDVSEVWKQSLKEATREHEKGRPFTANGAGSVIPVGISMRELAPANVIDRIETIIASVFGIPPVVLGFLVGWKNTLWSKMEDAQKCAINNTIEPMWREDSETLTPQLLHAPVEAGGRPLEDDPATPIGFDRAKVDGLHADRQRDSQVASRNRDTMTVNKRRIMIGLKPLPDDDPRGEEIAGGGAQTPDADVGGTRASLGLRAVPAKKEEYDTASQGKPRPLAEVAPLAEELAVELCAVALDVTIAGSIRRKRETVSDIDVVLTAAHVRGRRL